MDSKFMGLGLKNLLGVAIFTILVIVISKVVFAKYPVKGVTDIVHAI